jgi:hypothetical protein
MFCLLTAKRLLTIKEICMKNLAKLIGIIAIVTVIGFSMAACDEENGDNDEDDPSTNGRLTITSLGSYTNYTILCDSGSNNISPMHNISNGTMITGNSFTFDVWKWDSKGHKRNYTGNDQNVTFNFTLSGQVTSNNVRGTVTVNFSNGQATGAFVPNS